MAHSWGEIYQIVEARRSADSPLKSGMVEIRDRYNGDYVIPLPSVEGNPELEPPVPNLVADGIDGSATYAASTRPIINVPALDESKERGVRSREYANVRRRAYHAVWHQSQLHLQIRRAYRHLFGYGELSLVAVPDFKTGLARIEIRDPLTTYPEQRTAEDVRQPENVAYVYGRSASWILRNYPEAHGVVSAWGGDESDMWDMLEWVDENHIVIGVLGPRLAPWNRETYVRQGQFGIELRRWENRAGMAPVACGRRVTLDRIAGIMAGTLGNIDLMGRLMALDVLAAEKAIFPDRFVIGADGRPPQLLSGKWKDGRSGETNVLTDVIQVGELQSSPGPLTHPVIDRLESAVRQSGGVNPLFSGLMPNQSLRTGRAIDQFSGASAEPRIAEAQEIMSTALTLINEAVHEVVKGYFPRRKIVAFSGWHTDIGTVEFTPKEHFESKLNVVTYPFPGSDANLVAATLGGMVGAGLSSKHNAMAKHPYVADVAAEERKMLEESIEDAIKMGVQQAAVNQAIPIADLARLKQKLMKGAPIDVAVLEVDREAQERQAKLAPPAEEGQITAPEAQPGLSPPGIGAEQAPPETVQPPAQGLQNVAELFRALRTTTTRPRA